ncbi:hypothetical protein [Ottowia sp.]|uniref:hypothetical protein n=1 Tax=Ottowia sp. TaxID=1898956 RepID=UPI002C205964|nr:hypothetical protein [Ottowia sp.]HOB65282.1 hypothetical protein [Ottowia sp.]
MNPSADADQDEFRRMMRRWGAQGGVDCPPSSEVLAWFERLLREENKYAVEHCHVLMSAPGAYGKNALQVLIDRGVMIPADAVRWVAY